MFGQIGHIRWSDSEAYAARVPQRFFDRDRHVDGAETIQSV